MKKILLLTLGIMILNSSAFAVCVTVHPDSRTTTTMCDRSYYNDSKRYILLKMDIKYVPCEHCYKSYPIKNFDISFIQNYGNEKGKVLNKVACTSWHSGFLKNNLDIIPYDCVWQKNKMKQFYSWEAQTKRQDVFDRFYETFDRLLDQGD